MNRDQILEIADGMSNTTIIMPKNEDLIAFAEAIIKHYKDSALKEVGEPTCRVSTTGIITNQTNAPLEPGLELYTADQLIAARKGLEEEIERLSERRCEICGYAEHHREHTGCLRTQLAAAQELIAVLRKDAETYGPEKISLQKQAWLEADRQRQINDLKDQLAKAEQRVAEACALQVATETKFHWLDAARVAKEIRSGEYRKFMKGE